MARICPNPQPKTGACYLHGLTVAAIDSRFSRLILVTHNSDEIDSAILVVRSAMLPPRQANDPWPLDSQPQAVIEQAWALGRHFAEQAAQQAATMAPGA